MNGKITNIKVIYDNQLSQFEKAYVVIDGKMNVVENHREIEELLVRLKSQENKSLKEISPSLYQIVFKYDKEKAKNGTFVPSQTYLNVKEKWDKDAYLMNASLKRTSPYNGKRTSRLKKAAAIAGGTVLLGGVLAGGYYLGSTRQNAPAPEAVVAETPVVNMDIQEEKVNPETWEEFLEYEDTEHKQYFVNLMNTNLENNIKTTTANGKEYTYMISPDNMSAAYLYYNCINMSNEEILTIVGDYQLTGNADSTKDIVNQTNDFLDLVRLNMIMADSKEDMFQIDFGDEVVTELMNWCQDKIVEFKNADTVKEKQQIRDEVQEHLQNCFIDAATDDFINMREHPSAHMVLNTVPATFATLGYPFDEEVNDMLVGVEADRDVNEVNGIVDEVCSEIDRRIENFENYRNNLVNQKNALEMIQANGMSLQEVSEYDRITKDTYEYDTHDEHEGVMIPIMTEYLLKFTKVSTMEEMDTLYEEMRQDVLTEIQNNQLKGSKSSGEFSMSNPSGGQKGDTMRGPTVREEIDPSELTQEQREQAEQAAREEVGAVTEEEGQKHVEEVQANAQEVYNATFNYFSGTTEAGATGPYNPAWEHDSNESIRNSWAQGKADGLAYKDALSQSGQEDHITNDEDLIDGSITEDGSDVFNPGDWGEIGGDHDENTNQDDAPSNGQESGGSENENENDNSQNKPSDGGSNGGGSTITDDGADQTPDHGQNPNQPGNGSGSSGGGSTITDKGADQTPSHDENLNQKGDAASSSDTVEESDPVIEEGAPSNSVDNITNGDNLISGSETTDSEGAVDLDDLANMELPSSAPASDAGSQSVETETESAAVETQVVEEETAAYSAGTIDVTDYSAAIDQYIEDLANATYTEQAEQNNVLKR